jgi:inosine-uridine nucleoside N-ribohydrolase
MLLVAIVLASSGIARPDPARERRLPAIPPPGESMRVVIDADFANEVDDQYAVALALLSPERFRIEGFVAAHYGDKGGPEGIVRSVREIEAVLGKAGMTGRYLIKRGSHPLQYGDTPSGSEGVDFLIEKALASTPGDPLWIIALGPATDVVSAYLKEPRIADRVVVFWHGRTRWPEQAWNFNAYNDVRAVRTLFASDLPFVLFDTGTNLTMPMEESERRIRPLGPLGGFLHEIRLREPWYQSPTKGFFDLGDVAFLVDPSLASQEKVAAPTVNWDLRYDHKTPHGPILRVHAIDRDRTFDLLQRKLAGAFPE